MKIKTLNDLIKAFKDYRQDKHLELEAWSKRFSVVEDFIEDSTNKIDKLVKLQEQSNKQKDFRIFVDILIIIVIISLIFTLNV